MIKEYRAAIIVIALLIAAAAFSPQPVSAVYACDVIDDSPYCSATDDTNNAYTCTQCTGTASICTNGACVQCTSNSNCGVGQYCSGNTCFSCATPPGNCQKWSGSYGCGKEAVSPCCNNGVIESGENCEPPGAAGAICDTNANCGGASVCGASCTWGCTGGSNCAASGQVCLPGPAGPHCVACGPGLPCPSGQECSNDACVAITAPAPVTGTTPAITPTCASNPAGCNPGLGCAIGTAADCGNECASGISAGGACVQCDSFDDCKKCSTGCSGDNMATCYNSVPCVSNSCQPDAALGSGLYCLKACGAACTEFPSREANTKEECRFNTASDLWEYGTGTYLCSWSAVSGCTSFGLWTDSFVRIGEPCEVGFACDPLKKKIDGDPCYSICEIGTTTGCAPGYQCEDNGAGTGTCSSPTSPCSSTSTGFSCVGSDRYESFTYDSPCTGGYNQLVETCNAGCSGGACNTVVGCTPVTYYKDSDGDTFGTAATTQAACAQPAGFVTGSTDCNDAVSSVNPAALDACGNGVDDNCDGAVDETCCVAAMKKDFYADADSDGFGNAALKVSDCTAPPGYVPGSSDCNDDPEAMGALMYPGNGEICNGFDDDCDGAVDEGCDDDNDGYCGKYKSFSYGQWQYAGNIAKWAYYLTSFKNELWTVGISHFTPVGYLTLFVGEAGMGQNVYTIYAWTPADKVELVVFNEEVWAVGVSSPTVLAHSSYGGFWPTAAPPPWSGRVDNGVVVFNNNLWVLGGSNVGVKMNDVWSSTDGQNWVKETAAAQWSPREDMELAVSNGRMWLIGGRDASGWLGDLWSSIDGKSWAKEPNLPFAPEDKYEAIGYNGRLFMIGQDKTWSSSTDGKTWALLPLPPTNDLADGVVTMHRNRIFTAGTDTPGGFYSAMGSFGIGAGPAETCPKGINDCDDSVAGTNPGAVEACDDSTDNNCNGEQDEDELPCGFSVSIEPTPVIGSGTLTATFTSNDDHLSSTADFVRLCEYDTGCDWLCGYMKGYAIIEGGTFWGVGTQLCNSPLTGGKSVSCTFSAPATVGTYAYFGCGFYSVNTGVNASVSVSVCPSVSFYRDADADGFGDPTVKQYACSLPSGYIGNSMDCNDASSAVSPDAVEGCGNSVDDDCDGFVDEADNPDCLMSTKISPDPANVSRAATATVAASDGQFQAGNHKLNFCDYLGCSPAGGCAGAAFCSGVAVNGKASVSCPFTAPGAAGLYGYYSCIGSGVNKIDLVVCDLKTTYPDADGDGFGALAGAVTGCDVPAGYVGKGGDCNDDLAAVNPGAAEYCNGVDDNCDGQLDEGCDDDGDLYCDDTIPYGSGLWQLSTGAAAWPARILPVSAVLNGRMWVMGGAGKLAGSQTIFNDVWSSTDGKSWTQATAAAAWPARRGHVAVSFDSKLWVMGGSKSLNGANSNFLNDVWSSTDGNAWVKVTGNAQWKRRLGPAAVAFDGKLWVMGGAVPNGGGSGFARVNDVWSSASGSIWNMISLGAAWPARYYHGAVVFNGRMWVMGGRNGAGAVLNDVWSSTDGKSWTNESAAVPWSARSSPLVGVYNGRMWVMGGSNLETFLNDVWSSTDGKSWTKESAAAPWSARALRFNGVSFAGSEWLVGGSAGTDISGSLNDVWKFSSTAATLACQPGDCNDGAATTKPGEVELCGNGVDDNCDGQLDEGCDPDTSQALCTAAGKNWLGSGESAPFGGYTAMGALECCGDDSGEYLRITPIPGLGEPVACCNALTDCVDQSAACIASGTVQGAFKCNGGVWEAADGDIDEATCNAIAGTGHWAIGGEISGSACCGDDAGENERFRECSGAACTTLASDKACCNTLTDCVFNDKCYYNVNEALPLVESENTAFCNAFNKKSACTSGTSKGKCFWNDAISPPCKPAATKTAVQLGTKTGTTSFPAYADVDGDLSDEVCIAASPGQWQDTSGSIGGVVMNVTDPVAGAVVRVLGTVFKAMSAVDGSYSIAGLPSGNYDVVAEKDGYEQASSLSLFVPDSGIGVADFTLVHPLGGCEDDCTKVGSNLCDSSCHGKGKCWFSSDGIKAACHNSFGIGYMPDGSFVDCCMGPTYSPIKAVPSVPSDQVIIGRKPILYKGRFVNMVTIVFNK